MRTATFALALIILAVYLLSGCKREEKQENEKHKLVSYALAADEKVDTVFDVPENGFYLRDGVSFLRLKEGVAVIADTVVKVAIVQVTYADKVDFRVWRENEQSGLLFKKDSVMNVRVLSVRDTLRLAVGVMPTYEMW